MKTMRIFKALREKQTFDPDLTYNFDSREIFNKLLGSDKAADNFEKNCHNLSHESLSILKNRYEEKYQRIYDKALEKYNGMFSSFKTRSTSKFPDWEEIDTVFGEIIASRLSDLLPIIVTAINKTIGIRLYDVQIIAGIELYQKKVLEIKTGEGKTFIIPIAAILFGIQSKLLNQIYIEDLKQRKFLIHLYNYFQIKVVTANDYLARRDYSLLHPIYDIFNLSCYYIQEVSGRRARGKYFNFDILYSTCSHLCHLSLDDIMRVKGNVPYLPTFSYVAILDEIDQILLDEALTPHIISNQNKSKVYDIDITYQAKKFAEIITKSDSLFLVKNHKIYCSPASKYYFRFIFGELTAMLNLEVGATKISQLELFLKDLKVQINSSSQYIFDIFFELEFVKLTLNSFIKNTIEFLIDYCPFILKIIGFEYDLIRTRDNFDSIEKHILKLKSYNSQKYELDIKAFIFYIIENQTTFFIKLVNTLLFIGTSHITEKKHTHPKAAQTREYTITSSLIKNKLEIEQGVEDFFRVLLAFLGRYELYSSTSRKRVSFGSTLFNLINSTLPKMDKFYKEKGEIDVNSFLKFDIRSFLKFLNFKNGRLEIIPELMNLIEDSEKFKSYLEYKSQDIENYSFLESSSFISGIFQCLFGTMFSPIARSGDELITQLAELEFPYKKELIEQIHTFNNQLLNIKGFNEILSFMQSMEDEIFINMIEPIIEKIEADCNDKDFEEIIKKIEIYLTELLTIANDDILISEFLQQFQLFQQELRNVENIKEFNKKRLANLTIVIKFIGEMSNRTNIQDKHYEVISIFIAALFELIRVSISSSLFQEHANQEESDIDFGISYLKANPFLEKIINTIVIGRIVNPFVSLSDALPNYSMQVLTSMSLLLLSNNEFRDPLIPYYNNHGWIFGKPYFAILSNDADFKRSKLLGNSLTASKQYFKDLANFNLTRDGSPNLFFLQVQRNFNVISFYNSNVDYIRTPINKDLEPYKVKIDPYFNKKTIDQIQIIDRITGRVKINNRWSGYIHSAVEAKENMLVRGESLSITQITPQTYFANYTHLMGLSGTTIIAKREFDDKYGLEVKYIPTNKSINRLELAEKYSITDETVLREMTIDLLLINYATQNPILLILESINHCSSIMKLINILKGKINKFKNIILRYCKSHAIHSDELIDLEKFASVWNNCFDTNLSKHAFISWADWFQNTKIELSISDVEVFKELEELKLEDFQPSTLHCDFLHLCYQYISFIDKKKKLDVKILTGEPEYLTKESEIIKDAGKKGSVLISTRVAGRGTDIKLEDKDSGLFILIFNHQESLRHDQQIYGRCGRQGDVGFYRFYSSFESGIIGKTIKVMITKTNLGLGVLENEIKKLSLIQDKGILIESQKESTQISMKKEESVEDEESDNIVQLVFQQTKGLQTMYEISAHMQRIHEKRIGDIAFKYELEISNLLLGNNSWIQNLSNFYDSVIRVRENSFMINVTKFFSFGAELLTVGVDRKSIEEIIVGAIYSTYFEFVAAQAHLIFVNNIYQLIEEEIIIVNPTVHNIIDFKNEMESRLLQSNTFEDCLYAINLPKYLKGTITSDQEVFYEYLTKGNHTSRNNNSASIIMEATYKNFEHKNRIEALKLYNKFIELYKADNKFSLLVTQKDSYKKFDEKSKFITENIQKINQIINYQVCFAVHKLLENSNDPQWVKAKQFARYYLSINNDFVSSHDDIYELLIKSLKLSYNLNEFVTRNNT